MGKAFPVSIQSIQGSQWGNLGGSQLAQAVGLGLKAGFGGSVERRDGETLYYNGACEVKDDAQTAQGLYQHMVNRVLR